MAQEMEALIAKARRCKRPVDQIGCAYGLADLSTHPNMHEKLVRKGGIPSIMVLVRDTQNDQCRRLCCLALANCASHVFTRVIMAQEGVIKTLVPFIKDESVDMICRQYCAMCIGNLAAEPDNHEELVTNDAIRALMTLIRTEDIESGRYAAFGLGNIASNALHRHQVVDAGGADALVALLGAEDIPAQKYALTALRSICITPQYRPQVVQLGILDALVVLARLEDEEINRGVAAAINCLSTWEPNRLEICERCMLTLVGMLLSGDLILERHSTCCVANLVESTDIHSKFIASRGLPPLVALALSHDLVSKGEAIRAVANLSVNLDVQSSLLAEGILVPMVEALLGDDENSQRYSALTIGNLATTPKLQVKIVQMGALQPLIDLAGDFNAADLSRRYATLALANLSATVANHTVFLQNGGLQAVFSLASSRDAMSQYYVGCVLANLSCGVQNHAMVVEEGGLQPIITLAYSPDPDIHQQAAAALRGLSWSKKVAEKVVQEGALEPLVRLLTSQDTAILIEVCGALNNMSSTQESKFEIGRSGALPALIRHMQNDDMVLSAQSAACLATLCELDLNQKSVIDEGGLKPAVSAMRSPYVEVQREAGRLLANLCAADGATSDAVIESSGHTLLLAFLQSNDLAMQRVGAFGVGNLCVQERHRMDMVAAGALDPLVTLAMSPTVPNEIQRYAVLALANLASEEGTHTTFIEEGMLPHLVSLSNSKNSEIRQFAAFSLVKMTQNSNIRQIVVSAGGLEPVLYLARTNDAEIQREVVPSLCCLSFDPLCKVEIAKYGGLQPILTALTTANKDSFNTYDDDNQAAALEGTGARTKAGQALLAAKASNSGSDGFLKGTQVSIPALSFDSSDNGSTRSDPVTKVKDSLTPAQLQLLSCAALANMAEEVESLDTLVEAGSIPLLMMVLTTSHEWKKDTNAVRREACRALGNLCVSPDIGRIVLQENALPQLLKLLQGENEAPCSRMAALCLSNLSTGLQHHPHLLSGGILEPVETLCKQSLNPKNNIDAETVRYSLLILANLAASLPNHPLFLKKNALNKNTRSNGPDSILAILAAFSGHRDIKCRQNSVLAIGNLCANPANLEEIVAAGCVPTLATYAYPSRDSSVNVQFQAAAGLRGLASHDTLRVELLHENILEPLMLAATAPATGERKPGVVYDDTEATVDPEVQREVAAALCNLALSEENKVSMVNSDVVPALISLTQCNDRVRQTHATAALANLCEMIEGHTHNRMLHQHLLKALVALLANPCADVRREVARCYALLSTKWKSQDMLMAANIPDSLATLLRDEDESVARYALLAIGNLAVATPNHDAIFASGAVKSIMPLANSQDVEVRRGVAFALNNISTSPSNHRLCERIGVLRPLVHFLKDEDTDILLQSLVATRQLCSSRKCSFQFVDELQGLKPLLSLAQSSNLEVQREVAATLRNLSLGPAANSSAVVRAGGLDILLVFAVSSDVETAHQSLGVLANLAENIENMKPMVESGCLQRLKFVLRSKTVLCNREALRCLANLSAEYALTAVIAESGCLPALVNGLSSPDFMSQRHAAMGCGNIASNPSNQEKILTEGCLLPLLSLARGDNGDLLSQRFAIGALGSIAASRVSHPLLVEQGLVALLIQVLKTNQDDETHAVVYLALANLASNPSNHRLLMQENSVDFLIQGVAKATAEMAEKEKDDALAAYHGATVDFTEHIRSAAHDEPVLRCVSALRGLAVDEDCRRLIVRRGALGPLLSIAKRAASTNKHMLEQRRAERDAEKKAEREEFEKNGGEIVVKKGETKKKKKSKVLSAGRVWDKELEMETIGCLLNISLSGCIGENPVRFLQSIDEDTLVSFLCSTDRIFRLFGATAIGNSATSEALQMKIQKAGALEVLMQVGNSVDLECQRCVAYALGNMAANYNLRARIVNGGGLPAIISLACSENTSDQKAATSTLRGLAVSPLNRAVMVDAGALDAFAAAAKCEEDVEVRREAAAGLCGLSLEPATKLRISQHFVMRDLVRLAKQSDVATVRFAASTLANLAEDKITHQNLISAEGTKFLCKLVNINDIGLVREVCRCIANLSGNYDTHPQLLGDDAISCLTIAIRQYDAVVCRLATVALTNLAVVAANHKAFYERAPIVQVREPKKKAASVRDSFSSFGDEDEASKDDVISRDNKSNATEDEDAISVLSNEEVDDDEDDVDCFEFLVDVASGSPRGWTTLTESGNGDPVQEAANAAKAAAKQCDVAYDLYNELKEAHEKMKEEAEESLRISGTADPVLTVQVEEYEVNAKQALAEAEVETSMKKRARKNWSEAEVVRDLGYDLDARRYACLALANLCMDVVHHKRLCASGLVSVLRESLLVDDEETRFNASFAIFKLANTKLESQLLFMGEHGLIMPLIRLVSVGDEIVKTMAMACLRRLLVVPELRLEALECGILEQKVLPTAIVLQGVETRREACALLCHLSLSTRAMLPISKSRCILPLIEYCSSEDTETARNACGALANISVEIETHRYLIFRARALPVLIKQMRAKHLSVIREASRAVGNLLYFSNAHPLFLDANGLISLFLVARSGDNECQFNAAYIFRKLAPNMGTHYHIYNYPNPRNVNSVGIYPLFGLAGLRDERIQICAVSAMFHFASNQEYKVEFCDRGGLSATISLARSQSRELRLPACGALRHLSLTTRLKHRIVSEGGLGPIFDNIMRLPSDFDIITHCTETLANLTEDSRNKLQLPYDGAMPVIVHAASLPFGPYSGAASRAFCNLSTKEENVHGSVFGPHELQRLFHLSSDANPLDEDCCRDALVALGNIAVTESNQRAVAELGGIPCLAKTLTSSPYSSCQLYAARALYRVGSLKDNQPLLVEGGAITPLVQLSNDRNDVEAQRNSVMALCNATAYTPYASKIGVKLNALQVLLDLIKCRPRITQSYGAATTPMPSSFLAFLPSESSISSSSSVVSFTIAQPSLISLASHASFRGDGGHISAQGQRGLSRQGSRQELLRQTSASGSPPSTSHSQTSQNRPITSTSRQSSNFEEKESGIVWEDEMVVRYAATSIANLTSSDVASQDTLVKMGGLKTVISLANGVLPFIHKEQMKYDKKQDILRKEQQLRGNSKGSRRPYSSSLSSVGAEPVYQAPAPNKDAVNYCGIILTNMTSNKKHRAAIVRGGGLIPLAKMAQPSCSSEQRRSASLAFYQLSCATTNHLIMCGLDPKHPLDLSSKKEAANSPITQHDRDRKTGGILKVVVSLTDTGDADCTRFAMMTLANLSTTPLSRNEAVKYGCLQCAIIGLTHEDEDVKRYAAVALMNMTNVAPSTQSAAVVHGGLAPLLNIVKSPKDIHARRAALKAILNMSTNPELLPSLAEKGVIELIIRISNAADEEMKATALFTLCNLVGVADKATIVTLVRAGCCAPLIGLAASDDSTCRCLATVALRKLSTAEFAKLPMLRAGILDAAFDWLMRTAVHAFQLDPNSHHHAHHAHHHREHKDNTNDNDYSDEEADNASEASGESGSSDSNSDSDSDSDSVGDVSVPLGSSRSAVTAAEASVAKSMTTDANGGKQTKAQIAAEKKKQHVKYIKKMFGRAKHAVGEELEVYRDTMVMICNLSIDHATHVMIAKHHIITIIIALVMHNHDNEMARHSAGTLANILQTLATHRILCEPAAHSSLNMPHLQANSHHSEGEKVSESAKRHSIASTSSGMMNGESVSAVNSATIDDHMDKLKGDSCEVMMLRLLKHHDHDDGQIDVVREVVRGMSHFLTSVQFQNLTIKFGLPHLVRLLKSKDEEIRYAAIVALRKVIPNQSSHFPLCECGGVQELLKVIYPLKKGVYKVQGPLRVYDSLLEVQSDSKKSLKVALGAKSLESHHTEEEEDFVNESSDEEDYLNDEEIDQDIIFHSTATKGHAVAMLRDMLDNSHIRPFLVEQGAIEALIYMGFDIEATLLSALPSAAPSVAEEIHDYSKSSEPPRSTFLLHRHRVNVATSNANTANNGISTIGIDEDPDETEYPPYPPNATEVVPTDKYGNSLIVLQALRNISEDPELSSHLLRTYIKERKRRLNKNAVDFKDLELKKYAHEAEGSGLMDLISMCVNHGSNIDVCTQCSSIIANLATLSKGRKKLVQQGAVALLVKMARTRNRDARLDVARGLSMLCSLEDNHETVFRQGGFQVLIDFITKVRDVHDEQAVLYKGDSVVSTYAALAVRFLIMQPNVRFFVVQEELVACFIQMANAPHKDHRRTAALALYSISRDIATLGAFLDQGALPALLLGCLSDDPFIVNHSVLSLSNVVNDYSLQPTVVKAGGIGVMAHAVVTSRRWKPPYHLNAPLLSEATKFFLQLSVGDDLKELIVSKPWGDWPNPPIDETIDMLIEDANEVPKHDKRVRKDYGRPMSREEQSREQRLDLVELEREEQRKEFESKQKEQMSVAIACLRSLTKGKQNDTVYWATLAITNLSNAMIESRVEHKHNIMNSGVSRTLLRLTLHEDKRVRRCAAIAIGGLSLGDFTPCKIKHSFVELGAIPPLVDMMRTTKKGEEETLRCALLALNSLILGETLFPKTIAMHEYAIEPLLQIAAGETTQDIESIKQAVFSIGCLSESEDVRVRLVQLGAVKVVFGHFLGTYKFLLGGGQAHVAHRIILKRNAAYFIANLSQNIEFHEDLVQCGGLEGTLRLANDKDLECQEYATFTLAYLSSNRDLQRPLVELGVLNPLVRLMSSDEEPRQYAALSLLKLADNYENHVAIAKAGGLTALLKLGRGGQVDEEFKCAAVQMLGVIATNVSQLLPRSSKNKELEGDLGPQAEKLLESKTQLQLRNGKAKTLGYISRALYEAKKSSVPPVHMRPLSPNEVKRPSKYDQ